MFLSKLLNLQFQKKETGEACGTHRRQKNCLRDFGVEIYKNGNITRPNGGKQISNTIVL